MRASLARCVSAYLRICLRTAACARHVTRPALVCAQMRQARNMHDACNNSNVRDMSCKAGKLTGVYSIIPGQ
eukprot:4428259-Pleurochrysis_carterae.AAC.1